MNKKEAENIALLLFPIIEIPAHGFGVSSEDCANSAIDAVAAIRKEYPKIDEQLTELEELYST